MSKGGLAFLNKKSWHTMNIKHVELVWSAEQKAAAEKARLEELKKEKEEERQIEDLRRLQQQSGLITKGAAGRLDWMYSAPMHDTSSEEYLTGKEAKPLPDESSISKLQDTKAAGSLFLEPKVNDVLEMENRLREDPMMAIMREEQATRQAVLKNPLKMKKIRENAELIKQLKRASKKAMKKEAKKKAKAEKRASRSDSRRDHSDEDDSSDSERESSHKQRDEDDRPAVAVYPDNKYGLLHPSHISTAPHPVTSDHRSIKTEGGTRDKGSASSSSRKHSEVKRERSPDRRRSRSRSRGKHSHSSSAGKSKERRSRSRSRDRDSERRADRSRQDSRSKRSRSRSPAIKSARSRSRSPAGSSSSSSSSSSRRSQRSRSPAKHVKRSRTRSPPRKREPSRSRSPPVPSRSAHKAADKRRSRSRSASRSRSRADRHSRRSRSASRGKADVDTKKESMASTFGKRPPKPVMVRKPERAAIPQLSPEEQQRRIGQMMQDAKVHDEVKLQRALSSATQAKLEEQEWRERKSDEPIDFINDLNKVVYSGNESLEERTAKYKNRRQKGNTELHTFL